MAYVSVAEWRPEQVTEWLKGLDSSIVSYIHWFSNNEVNGQQLLNLSPDELTHLGVYKLGHQELILEGVQHLRNFHYELDRENLQLLALKLSCAAHSLYSEIRDQAESSSVPTQIMADVANVIHNVKPLVSWLDRPPFSGQIQYTECKSQLLSLSLEMATSAQRDRFADRPVAEIRTCSSKLAKLADSIIQDIKDPMILQPATLDLATIKKKVGEELDFFLVPSFHGIHQIGDMKLSSPAHQSGKIQQGDEIVQVNYQTVVGWSRKKVLALFEESPNDLLLTLKRRPRHVKIYGQIYMKPYRLPSRKRASPYSRWNDNLPSPRPELLTIPDFDTTRNLTKKIKNDQTLSLEPSGTSSSSDEEFGQPSDSQSPASMRLYLPKHRGSIQRRFTLSGPPRPSAQSEQFWRELQLERSWRSNQSNSQINNSVAQNVGSKEGNIDEMFQLRDKSASLGNSIASASSRSTGCVPFAKERMGSVKFDLSKFEVFKNGEKPGEKSKIVCDNGVKEMASKINFNPENITPESASIERSSLSITELNKLKRNAFFNNMDCLNSGNNNSNTNGNSNQGEWLDQSSAREGSSEKVKRVIDSFKSEISKTKKDASELSFLKSPGKVMELVGNFEKRENINNNNRPINIKFEIDSIQKFESPSKGTSEKNNSNVAYNMAIGDGIKDGGGKSSEKLENSMEIKSVGNHQIESEFSSSSSKGTGEIREEKINDDSVVEKVISDKKSTRIQVGDDYCVKSGSEIGGRSASNSFGESEKVGDEENHKMESSENAPDESSQADSRESDLKLVISPGNLSPPRSGSSNGNGNSIKPIPAQRKIKVAPEKIGLESVAASRNPFPLPPKPRTKFTVRSPEKVFAAGDPSGETPPEPPPRPDCTQAKSSRGEKKDGRENRLPGGRKEEGKITEDSSAASGKEISIEPEVDILISSTDLKSTVVSPKIPSPPVQRALNPKNVAAATSPPAPPLPPPPPLNVASPDREKPKTCGSTLDSIKAVLTLVRKPMNCKSPRIAGKKNESLLAKKRNVSVKEISPHENSGFLHYRNRKGSAVASWTKYFFVLQRSNFYGFKTRESTKADLFIHLPGFTCTRAEEVKSKDFSFKIYHTGTVFYFAANSQENLQQWLDCVSLAIIFQQDKSEPEEITFSQTDSDNSEEAEPEPETCFPTSPKVKKVLGSSSLPKPSRSHQNSASSDSNKKGQGIQRRFGSLKKLNSRKNATPGSDFSNGSETLEVASLDRKYLRFLGQKNSPLPVPTSGFRSYRRMHPTPVVSSKTTGKSKMKSKAAESNADVLASNNQEVARDPPPLTWKPLHSSNPSLLHPEMADYRIAKEKSSEFRRLIRNHPGSSGEPHRFLRMEQSLQTPQDDGFRTGGRNRGQELSGFITLEQFLLRQEVERQRSNKSQERNGPLNEFFTCDLPGREPEEESLNWDHPGQNAPSSPSSSSRRQGASIRSKKSDSEKSQHSAIRNKESNSGGETGKSKNVAAHQPPITSHSSSSTSQEESATFETISDQNNSRLANADLNISSSEPRNAECLHSTKNSNSACQGIEYPPAFEPETYILQNMLKSRQKRGQEFKK